MTPCRKTLTILTAAIFAAFTMLAAAQENDAEIEYLLTTVGSSNCVFFRNGTQHSSASAESHLRLKYGKARGHIDDADEFIDKLASESSWTGKSYTLQCPGDEEQLTRIWLLERLIEYRAMN